MIGNTVDTLQGEAAASCRQFQVAGDACQAALDELGILRFQFNAEVAATGTRFIVHSKKQ